jgi:hypothetical protein
MEQVNMATTKSAIVETTPKLLIQIDDVVREMTDEEYADYQIEIAGYVPLNPPIES